MVRILPLTILLRAMTFVLALPMLLVSCTGIVYDISGRASSSTGTASDIAVVPLYSNAANWNDWAKSGSNVACVGNEAEITDCEHGGDKRLVVTSYDSCSGLSMSDALGVFDWSCSVVNGFASFTSQLKST